MKKQSITVVAVCVVWVLAGILFPATAKKSVTLEFWTFVTAHGDFFQAQAERFAKEHPEYDFKLEIVDMGGEHHDKLMIALQAGFGAPDIADVEIQTFARFLKDIHFVELSDILEKYRDALAWHRVLAYSYKGEKYGVPTHVGTYLMFYNTGIFQNAGIDIVSTDKHYNPLPIKLWGDFVDIGKKITRDVDGDGQIDQWAAALQPGFCGLDLTFQRIGAIDKEGNFLLDQPKNIDIMRFLQNLIYKHKVARLAPGGMWGHHTPDFWNYVNEGHVAAQWMPQWYMGRYTEFMQDLSGKMIVRPLPRWEEGGFRASIGGGTGTVITDQCEEVEIAKEFLEFTKLTKEANIRIWTELGFDPPRKDVYSEPELDQPSPYWNNERVFRIIREIVDETYPQYMTPYWPEVVDYWNEYIAYPIIGEGKPVDEVIAKEIPSLKKKIEL